MKNTASRLMIRNENQPAFSIYNEISKLPDKLSGTAGGDVLKRKSDGEQVAFL